MIERTTTGRPTGWSLDSRMLYLCLDTDGFRDLWVQRVDTAGRLVAMPTLVRHLHQGVGSTGFGNAITAGGLVYERVNTTANLWRLTRQPEAESR